MLQFILLFLAINGLFIVARYTSRVIERQARTAYWYMKNRDSSGSTTTSSSTISGKVLPRQHPSVRQMLSEYFRRLEDEKQEKSDYERLMWTWYQQNISEGMRARDTARDDALPYWLEQLACAYNNAWIYNGALICLFFALTLGIMFCVPLDQPLAPAPDPSSVPLSVEEARRLLIGEALGYAVYHCNTSKGEFCYVEEAEIENPLRWPPALDCAPQAPHSPLDARYLWDKQSFQFYARTWSSEAPRLVHYWQLQRRLEMLTERERDTLGLPSAPCVCPVFLGLLDNVTLLYRGGAWLVMPRPVIHRVNAMASEVHSRVRYHYNSQLFDISQRLEQQLQMGESMHYNNFIVEYDQPQEPALTAPQASLGEQMSRASRLDPVPVVLQRVSSERVRLQLTGDDAKCYIYCDTMNARMSEALQQEVIN